MSPSWPIDERFISLGSHKTVRSRFKNPIALTLPFPSLALRVRLSHKDRGRGGSFSLWEKAGMRAKSGQIQTPISRLRPLLEGKAKAEMEGADIFARASVRIVAVVEAYRTD